jgi:hypothetical protein
MDDHDMRVSVTQLLDKLGEALGIAVGDVDADVFEIAAGFVVNALEFIEILLGNTGGVGDVGAARLVAVAEEIDQFGDIVILYQAGKQTQRGKRIGHLEGADSVHVGSHDRNATIVLVVIRAVVAEGEFTLQFHVLAAAQRAALGAYQHILVIEFTVFFDSHGYCRSVANSSGP